MDEWLNLSEQKWVNLSERYRKKEVIEFPVKIDDETIRCEITFEALRDNFNADLSNALLTFQIHRRFIEARAELAVVNGWFERDGSVRLTTKDCL